MKLYIHWKPEDGAFSETGLLYEADTERPLPDWAAEPSSNFNQFTVMARMIGNDQKDEYGPCMFLLNQVNLMYPVDDE